jgi:uncharacterized protein YkwD
MSARPSIKHAFLALALASSLAGSAAACQPAESLLADTMAEFERLDVARQPLDLASVDYAVLAQAVFHETNERRSANGRGRLSHMSELDEAACAHAEAMVEQDFFSHRNPVDEERATPADRVRTQGLQIGFVAENIGEVFALQYQPGEGVYVRREDGRKVFSREPGGEPLGVRSYLEVADALLDSWMASPGHRANILSEHPESFGSGCQLGQDDGLGMPMFRCVQLFFSPLR